MKKSCTCILWVDFIPQHPALFGCKGINAVVISCMGIRNGSGKAGLGKSWSLKKGSIVVVFAVTKFPLSG